ncbi:MAG: hypothetical protein IK152_06105 [Lachnospiraceae bacterium]|nr:hypothetical protein [Lachnospiraceae bacterium]
MKKMPGRLISILGATALVISMAGCGGGGGNQSSAASNVTGNVSSGSQAQPQSNPAGGEGDGTTDDLYSGVSNPSGGQPESQAQPSQAQPSLSRPSSQSPASSAASATRQVIYNQTPVVGGTVKFGAYEQDNDISNGPEPIDWIVLLRFDNGAYLLMSKYCLDAMDYDSKEKVNVKESAIIKWLNGEFYSEAFNEEEKKFMNFYSTKYNGVVKTDFLVSLTNPDMLMKNSPDINQRKATATEYAKARGAQVEQGQSWYWLFPNMEKGVYPDSYAACVNYDGKIMEKISINKSTGGAVRPYIVVRLDEMIKQ